MGSQYLVPLFCLLLALPAIQGMKVMEFKVVNDAKGTSVSKMLGSSTISERYAVSTMRTAYDLIRREIYKQDDPFGKKDTDAITLHVVEDEGFSFTQSNNEILVSVDYFKAGDARILKKDFTRNIYHAMTLVFLWVDENKNSDELKKGIADFIVLEAGFAPNDWAKPGEGITWSDRSDVTAQFLHYCDITERGFVARLVKDMKVFSTSFVNENVDPLWQSYKKLYKKE